MRALSGLTKDVRPKLGAGPRLERLTAAALTAYVREEDRLRALDVGFQMHIPKPAGEAHLSAPESPAIDSELF
jgi:CheY-like chemotaxis protein